MEKDTVIGTEQETVEEKKDFQKSAMEEKDEKHEHKHSQGLSRKEYYSLKEHKYEDAVKKFKTLYTILNKKTGVIVEMRAASPLHACTMIGWRPKNCKLIKQEVKELKLEEEVKIEETVEAQEKAN